MRSRVLAILVLSAALAGGAPARPVAAGDRMCVREARELQADCYAECRDDFLVERDLCADVDPACGESCRAAYQACKDPLLAIVEGCLEGCRSDLEVERAACPSPGDPGRDGCVRAARVGAFVCRDACRSDRAIREGRRACKRARVLCIRACPPPADGGLPPGDPGLG